MVISKTGVSSLFSNRGNPNSETSVDSGQAVNNGTKYIYFLFIHSLKSLMFSCSCTISLSIIIGTVANWL